MPENQAPYLSSDTRKNSSVAEDHWQIFDPIHKGTGNRRYFHASIAFDILKTLEQDFQANFCLQTRQGCSNTEVNSMPKAHMAVGISAYIKTICIGKL